ncbi:MAG TPA: efflux transporter outer membrane subunit [Steroidobacteraceae bacterium]|jgi:multidrug efflux system outer membrane protein|nr:efflux transporter outer membrane subunit [Steroidobacteraceae bacterium]
MFASGAMAIGILCVGCAGLPPKHKAPALAASAPLDGLELPGGGGWPAAEWWTHYQDSTLDQLIELALGSSPTLATAHARFDSARQSVRIAGAASGARVDANADIDRQRLSDNGLIPPRLLGFGWYNQADLGLQASYTFDWWGKQRDAVEAAVDQAHAAQADRSAAALMLASSIADTYFGWQADQARISLASARASVVQDAGAIAAARVKAELDAGDEMNRSELALASAREQIAALEGSAKLRVVALAGLVGRSIAELPALQAKPLPAVSGNLPDNVKIDLISRRADITASRWRVQAAERNLDSARAEFFPDLTINALLGLSSIDVGKLLEYGSRVPQASAAIHLPIFDAGRLKARYGATQAAIDSAVADYQNTLVSAARDVATQAATRAQIAAQRSQRMIQVDAARQLQSNAGARARQGIVDPREELTATESWLEQRDSLLQLDAAALSADIALQRALGGGYESPQELAHSQSTATRTP